MNWEGDTWNRSKHLDDWLRKINVTENSEWGRKKSSSFLTGYNLDVKGTSKSRTLTDHSKPVRGELTFIAQHKRRNAE